ncbi:MAG TPA: ABC transporter permease [Candidatus Sulfotelmatobacter sp.]|nr:ABC transporter permease [Candidatus Sulfotelmatobacter sp.]
MRFAIRQLSKSPGFTATIILTLALGIGGTTAIFSLIEGILLRPLAFTNPGQLVILGDHIGGGPHTPVTAREIGIYSHATTAFSSMGGYIGASYELSGGATPIEVDATRMTAEVFPTLGVNPVVGRVFTVQEEESHQPVAVISYRLWVDRYQRDPKIPGSTINLDRKPYTIVGVMPRSFSFPLETGRLDQTQLWVPMSLTADELSDAHAGYWGYHIIARLKDGVTVSQAAEDANRVAQQVMRSLPASQSAIHIRGDATPLLEYDVSDVRPVLRALFLAVLVVLLIACVNAAGLMLVKAIRRRGEYAVRLAIGARAAAIIRDSLVEGLLLGGAGGLLGLGFAALTIRATLQLVPDSMPRVDSISMDGGVAAFAICLALLTGGLCSLIPSFAALRTNVAESLKESARMNGAGHAWMRSVLVVAEVSIAMVLVTACGAFLRSLQKMEAVNPGFQADHVLAAGYKLPSEQYPTEASDEVFNRAVMDRLSSTPGIVAAGITSALPASGVYGGSGYTVEGESAATWKLQLAMFSLTQGDYFRAMQIPLLDGRFFTAEDRANTPPVIIVNESMARHCWPNQSGIGKRMHAGGPKNSLPWATVVGVVGNTKLGSRDETDRDQWYTPAEQSGTLNSSLDGGYVVVRSKVAPETMIPTLRAAVGEVDPLLALQPVETMKDVMSESEAPRRFNTDLITAFAIAALALAVTGIYAVVAFSVSQRRHEISIRTVLGSQRSGIARLVLFSSAKLAIAGCLLGVLGSLAVSRLVGSFLFDMNATDPLIYVAAVAVLIFMAILASALPALRAASADPIDALKTI